MQQFHIEEDKKKIEILKNFLEHSSMDWYSCMLMKFTVESKWDKWEKNFCDTFANKGWSPIRYALAFKYQSGSLLEYAYLSMLEYVHVRFTVPVREG